MTDFSVKLPTFQLLNNFHNEKQLVTLINLGKSHIRNGGSNNSHLNN